MPLDNAYLESHDHLGNVRAVMDGLGNIVSYSNYYAFGGLEPTRCYSSNSYRYGYNGQEKDDNILGDGTFTKFKFREYDNRIGRFMSVDPLASKYPWNSTYAFAENKVISHIDLEGLEAYYAPNGSLLGRYGNSTEIRIVYADAIQTAQIMTTMPSGTPGLDAMNAALYNNGSAPTYKSPDATASGWGQRYNGNSILDNKEYSSFIFHTKIEGKTTFSYTQPE